MATLSARGCKVLYRASIDQDTPTDDTVSKRRTERAYRSDGKILQKNSAWFRPDAFNPAGRKHDWGWTIWRTVKPDMTPERWAEIYRAQGWTVTTG